MWGRPPAQLMEQFHKMSVDVFDDVLDYDTVRKVYNFTMNSRFHINGWFDRPNSMQYPMLPCIHSVWTIDDANNSGLLPGIRKFDTEKKFPQEDPKRIMANLAHPGDTYFHHQHGGQSGLLYYVNETWQREWAGETIFYDDHAEEIIETVEPRRNRLVHFSPDVPHTMRPTSYMAPKYRLSVTMLFDDEELTTDE